MKTTNLHTNSVLPQKNNSDLRAGFTLIELMVVVAIIAILASIIMVSLNSARVTARNSERLAEIAQVEAALGIYVADNGAYPSRPSSPYYLRDVTGLTPVYMETLPSDPKYGGEANDYHYYTPNPNVGYVFRVYLEGVDDGADTWCRIVKNGVGGWGTTPLCSEFTNN